MNRRLFLATGIAVTTCLCSNVLGQTGNFRQPAEAINAAIRANHYRQTELDSDGYRQIEKDVIALGERATSAEEFIEGFNALWRKGPFSHVSLRKAQESAAERYAPLDTEMAGPDAVTLTWQGNVALLTVNTMSGADTIEAIDAAYNQIVSRKAAKLIIDLRRNGGGAFAVVPLVGTNRDRSSGVSSLAQYVCCGYFF
jgi:carboxyl-terminal processing protease